MSCSSVEGNEQILSAQTERRGCVPAYFKGNVPVQALACVVLLCFGPAQSLGRSCREPRSAGPAQPRDPVDELCAWVRASAPLASPAIAPSSEERRMTPVAELAQPQTASVMLRKNRSQGSGCLSHFIALPPVRLVSNCFYFQFMFTEKCPCLSN